MSATYYGGNNDDLFTVKALKSCKFIVIIGDAITETQYNTGDTIYAARYSSPFVVIAK